MQQLDQKTQAQAGELVARLKTLFGEQRLVSVCVYGSAVFGDTPDAEKPRRKEQPDINTLVVLKTLETADLEKASEIGKWWNKKAHALPLFFSEQEWLHSADVYALEYADIRDNHHVIYGADLYNDVEVHKEAMRLICELELHRKILFLRQRLLLFRDDPKILVEFMHRSVADFAAVFRGVLRLTLSPDQVSAKPGDVFRQLEKTVDRFDATPFLAVLDSCRGVQRIDKARALRMFEAYLAQVSVINLYLNEGVNL